MSSTQVFQLDAAAAVALEKRLHAELTGAVDWRRVDHARWAVKAAGVNAVCYKSGKLVVQGKAGPEFAARFLAEGSQAAPIGSAGNSAGKSAGNSEALPFEVATVGSDEAGKGDFFGPLVVAAVFAEVAQRDDLKAMGVADSKSLTDKRMYPIAERIESTFACEVRVLMPAEYNERWRNDSNVNHILADMHADAIAALISREEVEQVVVDRFGNERLVRERLQKKATRMPSQLVQVPRAEAHPVVAAASIVARVRFLEGLARCQEESGTDLHKGAGDPVDVAARRAFAIGGAALLERIAKVHFKNSQRIPGFAP